MAKQSVIDMLKKPVYKPQVVQTDSVADTELRAMAMRQIHKSAMDNALAELKPKLDEAEAKVNRAETELAVTKADLATAQAKIIQMEAMHAKMETMLVSEKAAKVAANKSYEAECVKTRLAEKQVSILTAKNSEMERHNQTLQTNMNSITTEIGKRKPEQIRSVPVMPEFEYEVTSRGLKGEIKTMLFKPKK